MMNKNKSLYTLSLARRAGKLAIGFTATKNFALQKKASLIIVSLDASERTKRNILLAAGSIDCIEIPFTGNDIEDVFKRRFAVAAITDNNFKELFLKALEEDMDVNKI